MRWVGSPGGLRPRASLVLAYALASATIEAQDSLALDPTIHHVVTGGRWRSGADEGWYRAVIITGGREHLVSQLTLEWIQERSEGSPVLARSLRLVETGCTGRLDEPRFRLRRATWRLVALCTPTHRERARPWNVTIVLGQPGTARALAR